MFTPIQKEMMRLLKEENNDNNNKKCCKKCGYTLKTVVRQTRKGDEGMTVFTICETCFNTHKT